MEENIIIKGEFNRKRVVKKLIIGAVLILALAVLKGIYDYIKLGQVQKAVPSIFTHMTIHSIGGGNLFGLGYFIAAAVLLAAVIIWHKIGQNELNVSEKRIWGKIGLGKKVDMPINNISSFSYGKFGSMNFGTDEGKKVKIWHLRNRGMVYTAITAIKKRTANNK